MKKLLFSALLFVTMAIYLTPAIAQTTEIQYLSGLGKDDPVEWDFFCTKGNNSGKWTKIGVPSNWELKGFGSYNYGHDKDKADEQGLYKYSFTVPKEWVGKEIFIVFDGSMTDTEVKINGKLAGPIHQGAFYQFRYNITSLIKPGRKNLLEATVSKMSANATINEAERKADFWVFGGIFRPVWLEAHPAEYIDRIAVDARADGSLSVDIFPGKPQSGRSVEARLFTADGKPAGTSISGTTSADASVRLTGNFSNAALWSPEFPNLYQLQVSLKQGEKVLHTITKKIGFRTVDLRERDGIYINGQKIRFKGVNRHSFYPTSGRTTSKELSIEDVKLMKEMNMNAVRMSHYPPDSHFLDVCDSLGLFVLDELTAWQYPPYDTEVGTKLVHELVKRDVNHPSVVMWDNGNEGGFNFDLVPVFKQLDPQQRPVIHPWMLSGGADTQHYTAYGYGAGIYFNGHDIFFPTEFSHGLYDGGHGATLDDFWNLMLSNPLSAGGFLWDFCDQAVVRTDKEGFLDTGGNLGADGIVGPYREKEGSFYTIKEIWSPVFFEKRFITPAFDGTFPIENRYHYTNLNQCRFSWKLKRFDTFVTSSQAEGSITSPDLAPWQKGVLKAGLPSGWEKYDVLYLTATDPHGMEINTWSWNISRQEAVADRWIDEKPGRVTVADSETAITLSAQGVQVAIDKKTGLLSEVRRQGKVIPLTNGPVLIEAECTFKEIKQYAKEEVQVVEVSYQGRHPFNVTWTMHPSGWLELNYDYRQSGQWWLMGVTFDFPEELVKGAALLADGPYRVWKNRLKGVTFDLREKAYNNTITGESWEYPEFKGYYSNFYGMKLQAGETSFTVLAASEDLYLHLFTPEKPKGASNANTSPVFPAGNLSFLHAVSPVGTKFQSSEIMGPQGQKNMYSPNRNQANLKGRLFFDFR